jgi:hypothetical protein
MSQCAHEEFAGDIKVARFTDSGRFMAEITIKCAQCGTPFQFIGLEPGLHLGGARCSLNALEARIAIVPVGRAISPLQDMLMNLNGPNA